MKNQMPSRAKILKTLEKNRGNLVKTYAELKAPITFFALCRQDEKIREVVEAYREFQTRLAEEMMFNLLKSQDEDVTFKSSKFILEHLDRGNYAPQSQQMSVQVKKDGDVEVDIKGIFGIQ